MYVLKRVPLCALHCTLFLFCDTDNLVLCMKRFAVCLLLITSSSCFTTKTIACIVSCLVYMIYLCSFGRILMSKLCTKGYQFFSNWCLFFEVFDLNTC